MTITSLSRPDLSDSTALPVFDRTSGYDPNIDAIVRVEARRLRAKLKAYYEEGLGVDDPL